ncbi:MAG TPA: hypothetical protein VKA06_04950 [Spirochaetia bacterium]|nr:hypothetical protein [Spirochaetia bacterium]
MRIRIRRPRYQRNVRILLAFALLIPAGGIVQAAGANEVSIIVGLIFVALAGLSLYDAARHLAVITRHGIGIVGTLGSRTVWLAWGEILQIDVTDGVVSLTTRDRAIYQLQLDYRAASVMGRMVERQIVGRGQR